MRARSKVAIDFACLGAFGAVAALMLGDRQPKCEGRTLSNWLWSWDTNYPSDNGRDFALSAEATNAILNIGTNAIQPLLQWMIANQSPTKKKLQGLIAKLPDRSANSTLYSSSLRTPGTVPTPPSWAS